MAKEIETYTATYIGKNDSQIVYDPTYLGRDPDNADVDMEKGIPQQVSYEFMLFLKETYPQDFTFETKKVLTLEDRVLNLEQRMDAIEGKG